MDRLQARTFRERGRTGKASALRAFFGRLVSIVLRWEMWMKVCTSIVGMCGSISNYSYTVWYFYGALGFFLYYSWNKCNRIVRKKKFLVFNDSCVVLILNLCVFLSSNYLLLFRSLMRKYLCQRYNSQQFLIIRIIYPKLIVDLLSTIELFRDILINIW